MDKNESTRTSNMRSPSVPNVQKPVKRDGQTFRCAPCGGDGQIQCHYCEGHRQLRWFIRLLLVTPVTKFPEAEINKASQRLLSRHLFPQRVIHMQRHVIRMVPVTRCLYEHKEKYLFYYMYVYGLESKVHVPDYPE
uniref:Uncharacterized protein n=1 Tax=Magallana gigas TaxID=29159 RepID=A0A8W8IYX0_MAGGI